MARMDIYFPTKKEKEKLIAAARKAGISPSSFVRSALRYMYLRQKHEDEVRYGK